MDDNRFAKIARNKKANISEGKHLKRWCESWASTSQDGLDNIWSYKKMKKKKTCPLMDNCRFPGIAKIHEEQIRSSLSRAMNSACEIYDFVKCTIRVREGSAISPYAPLGESKIKHRRTHHLRCIAKWVTVQISPRHHRFLINNVKGQATKWNIWRFIHDMHRATCDFRDSAGAARCVVDNGASAHHRSIISILRTQKHTEIINKTSDPFDTRPVLLVRVVSRRFNR